MRGGDRVSTISEQGGSTLQSNREETSDGTRRARPPVDVEDASRLLEVAAHDIAVASTCIGLGDLDEAHTNVLTARVAADAAEEILRTILGSAD
jgi:hypothetical protein